MLLEGKTAIVYGGAGSIGSAVARGLAAEGATPSLHFIPIQKHSVHRAYFGDLTAQLPASEAFYRGCFSLPLFPGISADEVDAAAAAVRKLLHYYAA